MHIRFLSNSIINQIAAGEIIESYVNIVKELVENAIDAGALKIDISIDFPITEIIVQDNGHGMLLNDLKRSILKHTTSKLHDDDLVQITSLGFRGEALAAIASISHMKISTNQKEKNICELESTVGNIQYAEELQYSHNTCGTKIIVKNIFFNTPVRLKFLQSDEIEYNKIVRFIKIIALSSNDIELALYKNNIQVMHYGSNRTQISSILGDTWLKQTKQYHINDEQCTLTGYAGNMNFLHFNNQHQYFFINGRYIEDRNLSSILKSIYNSPASKYPCLIAYFTIPCNMIDVNIHPQKTEIRFRDLNYISQLLKKAILGSLYEISSTFPKYKVSSVTVPKQSENTTISSWNNYELRETNLSNERSNIFVGKEYILLTVGTLLYIVKKIHAYQSYIKYINKTFIDINHILPINRKNDYRSLLIRLGIITIYKENKLLVQSIMQIYQTDKVLHILSVIHSFDYSIDQSIEMVLSCANIPNHSILEILIQYREYLTIGQKINDQILSQLYNMSSL